MAELQELKRHMEHAKSGLAALLAELGDEQAALQARFDAVRSALASQDDELKRLPARTRQVQEANKELTQLLHRLLSVMDRAHGEMSALESREQCIQSIGRATTGSPEPAPCEPEASSRFHIGTFPSEPSEESTTSPHERIADTGLSDGAGDNRSSSLEAMGPGERTAAAETEDLERMGEAPGEAGTAAEFDAIPASESSFDAASAEPLAAKSAPEEAHAPSADEGSHEPSDNSSSDPVHDDEADDWSALDVRGQQRLLEKSYLGAAASASSEERAGPDEQVETLMGDEQAEDAKADREDEAAADHSDAEAWEDPIKALREGLKSSRQAPWWKRFG